MKKVFAILLVIIIFASSSNTVYAHKPIQSDGTNTNYENSLLIPDHKISWAIYEQLEAKQTKFYKFDAKEGDSFYSSIVIPKLDRLENYKPGLALIGENIGVSSIHKIDSELPPGGIVVYDYDGVIPSSEFYEPFTQTTYWERQEIRINIPADGTYYIVVFDNQGMLGKYSLAVGVIEDFSMVDFFTTLPLAWIQTKIFFEDYLIVAVFFGVVFGILGAIGGTIVLRNKRKLTIKKI